MIRRLFSFASFLLLALLVPSVFAQCVSLTTIGSASTQNFDTLSNTAGSTTNNLTITGWFMTESGGGARDNEQYAVDTGSSNTGDTYSYGAAGSTERALGTLRSGTLIPSFGACFTNNTGATVNSLAIAYTGEQWRLGTAARTDQLTFEYSLNATDLVTGTWTGVAALNFVTPDTATTGAKIGNAAASRTALSSTISSLSIANGATFWIRWTDTDASGADDGLAVDDFSLTPNASAAAPTLSVNDVSLNEGNAGTTSFTFTVSLSAPAPVGGVTFDIATADGTATVTGSDYVAKSLTGQTIPAGSSTYSFTVLVNGDTAAEPSESFFVNITNVVGATVGDSQGQGAIVNDDFSISLISAVQGSGPVSPVVGQTVAVEGIVVGAFQAANQLQGFFLQEEDAQSDGNSATSEGIFVFCGGCPTTVVQGQKVMVVGAVSEFNNMTQITASTAGSVSVTDAGNNLALVTPATITLPIVGDIDTYYEAREGMLVTYGNTLTVTEHFELARYGHIVLHEGGRPFQFTETTAPSAAGYLAHQDAMARRRVVLDDDNNAQEAYLSQAAGNQAIYYPRANGGFSAGTQGLDFFRAGDTVTALTGVLHWSFPGFGANTWRIRPSAAHPVSFTPANPRPSGVPVVGGAIKAASVNMLNYFTTIDTTSSSSTGPCGPTGTLDCRGADSVAELNRQRERASVVLCGLNADVFGLMEMENTTASDTVNDLLGAVNTRCGGSEPYAFVSTGGTLGTDAIRVVQIYRTGVLSPVGAALVDMDAIHNRPPTAQTFDVVDATNPAFGERFTVVANHFKSKGCSGGETGADVDSGDGQACYAGRRTSQATRLMSWINSTVLPAAGDPDVLLLGDFNSYGKETPVTTLTGGGYTDIASAKLGASTYSYLFDAELGHLDYAFSSPSLTAKVVGAGIWHINADEATLFDYSDEIKDVGESTFEEKPDGSALTPPRVMFTPASPFRASDHDPVLVGLFPVANVSITKVGSPNPVTAGNNLTWTITVANAGPDAAATAAWSDTLPAGTTFVSLPAVAGWTCATPSVGAGGTVSCNNASMALGSTVFTLTAAVSPTLAASTLLSNTATVTAATADPDTGNNSATATTTVGASADLQITKTATPNSVVAGSNLTYAIAVKNAGPSIAAAVAMSDTLPVGTTFVSLSAPGGWTCTTPAVGANGTVACNISSLALGSASFTLVVKVNLGVSRSTVLSNTATATSSTPDPTTPVTATATATVLGPELTIGGLSSPTYVAPGQTFSGLLFECRNNGTASATDVNCTPGAGPGTMSALVCTPSVPVAMLAPGETIRCTYDFTGHGVNGGSDEPVELIGFGGSMSASNFAVLGQLGGLFMVGDRPDWMLDAVDDGPTVAFNHAAQTVNVLANDSIGDVRGISSASVEVTANGAVTCVVGCTATPAALFIASDGTVTVPALAGPGTYRVPYRICRSNPAPFAAACDTAIATIIVQGADMVSTIACTPTQATEGTPITCTATCTNNGPATAVNAVCSILNTASLPAGASAPVCPGSPAATLAAGSSLTCTVGFQMSSAGSITVSAGGAADNDPVGGNSPSAVGNSVSATLLLLSTVPIPTLGALALMLLALMLAAFGFAAGSRSRRA